MNSIEELKRKAFTHRKKLQGSWGTAEIIFLSDALEIIRKYEQEQSKAIKQARIDENKMYYSSMTSIYYDEMNNDKLILDGTNIWLKIRKLFEKRIEDLEGVKK